MRHPATSAGALAALVLVVSPLAWSGPIPPSASPSGPLVMVGNRLDAANEPVHRAILGLRLEGRPLCVLDTGGSKIPDDLVALLERHGGAGAAVEGPRLFAGSGRADREKIARSLEECGGFYFVGGATERAVDVLHPEGRSSLAEQAILRVHRRGGVIATSGGATPMMSDPMLAAGSSDEALTHGQATADGSPGVRLRGGSGFFRGGLVDARGTGDGHTGRLLVALAGERSADRAFAIEENTALVMVGTQARVVGDSWVIVLERLRSGPGSRPIDGSRFRVLLLGNGDSYDLLDGGAAVEGRKEILRLGDLVPTPPEGPWVADALPLFLVGLSASRVESGAFSSRGYRFLLTKEPGFEARAWEIPDGRHVPHGFTAGWFRLDVARESAARDGG